MKEKTMFWNMMRRTVRKSPLYIAFTLLFRRLWWFSSSRSDTPLLSIISGYLHVCRDRTGHFCTAAILAHVWLRYYTCSVVGATTYCWVDSLEFEILEGKRFYLLQTGAEQIWCLPSPPVWWKTVLFFWMWGGYDVKLTITRIVYCVEIKK